MSAPAQGNEEPLCRRKRRPLQPLALLAACASCCCRLPCRQPRGDDHQAVQLPGWSAPGWSAPGWRHSKLLGRRSCEGPLRACPLLPTSLAGWRAACVAVWASDLIRKEASGCFDACLMTDTPQETRSLDEILNATRFQERVVSARRRDTRATRRGSIAVLSHPTTTPCRARHFLCLLLSCSVLNVTFGGVWCSMKVPANQRRRSIARLEALSDW